MTSPQVEGTEPRGRDIAARPAWLGALLGSLISAPALIGAIASAGAGHGDYVIARLAFPFPMLLTRLTGDIIGPLSIASAIAQLPLYGALIGGCIARRRMWPVAALLVAHLALAVIA
ncbi:MAG: hypothetical protein ABIU10_01985, partial [Sphingomicrobium sp.]